jgi:hypothetical protein
MKREREELELAIRAAEDLIEKVYPAIPERYDKFKVDKKDCLIWANSGALHILQSKQAVLIRARKNYAAYDTEEKIIRRIFTKSIWLKDICEFDIKEDRTCVMYFRENGDYSSLTLNEDGHRFATKMRSKLAATMRKRAEPVDVCMHE